ncbi:MAG: SPOR domain-containing protein [Acinetobacter sp.]|nr:SPOR domain-containing protein [Acinetobacter sp.]
MLFKKQGISKHSFKKEWSKGLYALIPLLLILGFIYMIANWTPWQAVDRATLAPKNELPAQEKYTKYRFYELLPKQHVTPLQDNPVATETADNQDGNHLKREQDLTAGTYILYIKSFDNIEAADKHRSQLLLTNTPLDIITVVEKKKMWYRVIGGPFSSLEEAEFAKQNLYNNNVDSLLREIKNPSQSQKQDDNKEK